LSSLKIFEITECVVCMDENSTEIIVPCGHLCLCKKLQRSVHSDQSIAKPGCYIDFDHNRSSWIR
jgi:hypothetical protein